MFHWWAIEEFAEGHRAIRKIGCLVQKSLISFISSGELKKIGDSNECADVFLGDQGKDRSPKGEDLCFFLFWRSGQ